MAEGVSERHVYFTRSRKRSSEQAPDPRTLEPLEKETPDPRTVETSVKAAEDVIDLTHDEECETDSPAKGSKSGYECAICLQTCVHPARLPCGHIFCFLCVKGAAHGNRKCAMCRSPIPHNYFNNPDLVETPEELTASDQEGYEWFYEGRNGGWWQYEERMSKDIEESYTNGEVTFQTLICGSMYTIDMVAMTQYKMNAPWQMRRIKREKPSRVNKRGIAGIS